VYALNLRNPSKRKKKMRSQGILNLQKKEDRASRSREKKKTKGRKKERDLSSGRENKNGRFESLVRMEGDVGGKVTLHRELIERKRKVIK